MRRKLLDLTTLILSRDGYSGTTQQKLMEEAGLGRGSVLHQFPTRDILITEVTRYISDLLLSRANDYFSQIPNSWECLRSYPDIIWSAANSVPGLALAEIASATRREPGLYDRIHEEIDRLNQLFHTNLQSLAKDVGVDNVDELAARVQLLIAGCHGLVQDKNFHHRSEIIAAALIEMKKDYLRYLAGIMVK